MKLIEQTHQVNFFTNNSDVVPNTITIGSLLERLGKFGLIPTFGQEINAISGEKKQILIMMDSNQKIRIEFPSHGILFNGLGGEPQEFIELVLSISKELQTVFPVKKGNRIAVLNSRIYQGSDDAYSTLYDKLFTFKGVNPFEWDNRIAIRKEIQDYKEEINSISTVRRTEIAAPFLNNGMPSDCVFFDTDTNTLPQNAHVRFSWEEFSRVLGLLQNDNLKSIESLNRYTAL
ncbi:hypothetical protein [Erwinia billingiae]|uniref:hypothetical protein n=1 Tax=Erwinia billingiae TaxID=182337 RepID=UPI000D0909BB|nr:hypothetical protein [Erwinia billingiae]PRB57109.1 hypothetical protein CQ001_19140 [Erwinia billingiae]